MANDISHGPFASVDDLLDYLTLTVKRKAPGSTSQRFRLVHVDTLSSAIGILAQQREKITELERALSRRLAKSPLQP